MADTSSPADRHPIQVAVLRSGVSADLLRAWEKRYRAVTPSRSDGGRRLYSDQDIERLRLLHQAQLGGRRIGDVASLPTAELERIVAEDQEERADAATASHPSELDGALLDGVYDAVRRADQTALRSLLTRALLLLGPARFTDDVARPVMHRLGELWEEGALSPAHEHAASEVMRRVMHEMLHTLAPAGAAPTLVVATPTGQRHEIGALVAAVTAALEGWRVTYLGSDLPAADIAQVARDVSARALALSVTTASDTVREEIVALSRVLKTTPILVGGQHGDATAEGVANVRRPADLAAFRRELRQLAQSELAAPTA